MSCISCAINNINNVSSESKLVAIASINYGIIDRLSSNINLTARNGFESSITLTRLSSDSKLSCSPNVNYGLTRRFAEYSDSNIRPFANINGIILSNIVGISNIPSIKTDKFSGNKLNFTPYEKLYPSEDIYFISKDNNSSIFNNQNIYSLVDEGVFTQDYTNNNSIGTLISDDSSSQVFPFNVFSDGDLEYKFVVNKPFSVAKKSYFALRASAPFDSYKDRYPQNYKIYDIKLEDPSGNLIIQYEDINVKGDTYFTTYVSQPKINNLLIGTWESNYPLMDDDGDYTLRFSLSFECSEFPFDSKFDSGFEESCILSSGNDDTSLKNLLISSIEIGNSGGLGILRDNYINLFNYAQQKSQRVTKSFIPTKLLITNFDNGIYPQSSSTWVAFPQQVNNNTEDGAGVLLHNLNSPSRFDYILLSGSLPHQDSGRLILKFDTTLEKPSYERKIGGGFGFGVQDFNSAIDINYIDPDVFFEADSLRLKITAKKSENTPDFSIDVVGYSDDKLLNITSPIGGFLQNDVSSDYITNEIPDISGIKNTSFTISENALSDDDDYFKRDISVFGDHYNVTISPLVNSTEFAEYIIPLQIRHSLYDIGPKTKYGLTSFLENLYIDISPIPSGAIISNVSLIVDYIPSDGLMLHTMGCPSDRYMEIKSLNLIPSYNSGDYITNTSGVLTNIPHGLLNPPNLKTNYSRRWRGVNNSVGSGAFDILAFHNYEFEFNYPTNPFLYCYVDFSNSESNSNNIKSVNNNIIGEFVSQNGNLKSYTYQNLGWRLSDKQLFDNNPTTEYTSIAWKDNIYDAFDRAVRVSGVDHYITLDNVPLSESGWAIFLRFTPDNTIPNNHCLVSRVSNNNFVNFQLKYNNGKLRAEIGNAELIAEDTLNWDEYQYPLSVLVTYNDDLEGKLKIYTDNELKDTFTHLAASSQVSGYTDSENNLNIGYCDIDNSINLPMFVHEFGISNNKCNLVPNNSAVNRSNQEISISEFFKSHRMHFWKSGDNNYRSEQHTYIDDDISKWQLGDFKICSFSSDFNFFTNRDGNDYLIHNLASDGLSYFDRIALNYTNFQQDLVRTIDDRIANKDPNNSKNIFSTKNHNDSIYVRDTNCWASDFDLTCLSPWNSAGGEGMGGVLVSPRHVLFCRHSSYYPPAGSTVRFINNNNQVVEANIISETDIGFDGSTGYPWDITVAYLDRDVASSGISVAKILPDNYFKYLDPWSFESLIDFTNRDVPFEIPVLFVDPEDKALILEFRGLSPIRAISEFFQDLSPFFSCLQPSDIIRLGFFENVITGDSGSASMLIIDNTVVLLGVSSSGGIGTGGTAVIAETVDRVNAAMNQLALSAGDNNKYELTKINLDLIYTQKSVNNSLDLSNINYHTQVENDFLRFNLSNIPEYYGDTFYGISPRISKSIPRGYKFNEEGICVDTIIEHETDSAIVWSDGSIGPKLIVSLYTPILNYDTRPSKDFGLINRSIHYLEPSGCYRKITSKFTFENLLDTSEPWSIFDKETYQQEFKERYFSREINDMYLQYDVIYPSGSLFNSNIKIHSANVRLDSSLILSSGINSNFILYASGNTYQDGYLNLVGNDGCYDISESGLFLSTSGNIFNSIGDISLFIDSSGIFAKSSPYINLHTLAKSSITFTPPESNPTINFYIDGQYIREESIPLHTYGEGIISNNNVSFVTFGKDSFLSDSEYGNKLSLYTLSNQPINVFPSSYMPLFIDTIPYYTFISNTLNLFTEAFDPNIVSLSNSLNLHTLNYSISASLADTSASINWNSTNTGNNITSSDNVYAYVDADDNIRGVDIICYGDCFSSSSCSETPITIHGTKYYENNCVDGGIFRAQKTYTNLEFESGIFKHNGIYTEGSYSGHFYGIRKYSGLAPFLPYNIIIEGQTGSARAIDIPPEFIEVEYNQDEEDNVDSYNRTLMNYNGIRLISNSDNKNSGDEFGKSVAAKKDLLVIGVPKQTIIDNEGEELDNAGSVFIYKRRPRPSGFDWNNDFKSPWILETELSLPIGLRKDYYLQFPEDKISFEAYNLSIQKTRWYTGQEGREFGHSVDLAINDNQKSIGEDARQIIVVGGPNAKWSRTFPEFESQIINIGIMAFIDEFNKTIPILLNPRMPPVILDYTYILQAIENKDFLYRYFANPSVRFNINLLIYVTNADDPTEQEIIWTDRPNTYPLSITVKQISRNQVEEDPEVQTEKIISGMKDGFFEAFPSSGDIPPIVGFYVDNSFSLGKDSLQPALSGFIDFYKNYSYASGSYTNTIKESGQVVELIPSDNFDAKNWIYYSNKLINDVLDSGNIVERNHLRFITNDIGEFYGDESEFNIPPESGGKVYIFEKESGYWNLIQEIKSPNVTYDYPDRFGHCVSISDNAEVIAIGSPYINQAVMAYEYKPEQKINYYNGLYNWIISKGKELTYANAINNYENNNDIEALYLSLTPEDKFLSRRDLGIEEYKNILSFGYGDIQPVGSWSFIPNAVAPTSRLGYSIDVSEDGNKIVVGSPTDSLNQFNDADVYYAYNGNFRGQNYTTSYSDEFGLGIPASIKSSWASTLNAGAIHLFEARNYYPHNAVVEYGRFGNLHRSINDTDGSLDNGHFEYISGVFSDKTFIRTEFTQNYIPQEAGLLFIITPEIDALSDEVADNLINWLSLGDRNLVLVGNDPIWENNGAYKESNNIINKILSRLNSRMKIVPARNKYESLPNGYVDFNNVLPSFVPFGITSSITKRLPLRGSGVADIRITNTFSGTSQDCSKQLLCGSDPPPTQIQSRCEMPLLDGGDLRAQSIATCCADNGKPLTYYINWPYEYKTYIPSCADIDFDENRRPFINREPIPLLTAAEKVNIEIDVPEIPPRYVVRAKYIEAPTDTRISYIFGSPDESRNSDFIWLSTNNNYDTLEQNYTNKTTNGLFIDPPGSGLLEATGQLRINDVEYEIDEILDDKSRYCVAEKYADTDSEIVLLANVDGEVAGALTTSLANNNDKNRGFYLYLLEKNSSLAQLSLWQNESSSFSDAVPGSILSTVLSSTRVRLRQNISIKNLLNPTEFEFDNAWISNVGKYSELSTSDINDLKIWLSRGKKKLFITYDHYSSDEDKKNNLDKITNLCNNLGLKIKPLKSGSYKDNTGGTSIDVSPMQIPNLEFIDSTFFAPYNPISISGANPNKIRTLAYQSSPIIQKVKQVRPGNYWYMEAGVTKVSFPVISNSAYKIFIVTDKHTDEATVPLTVQIGNAISQPELPSTNLQSTPLIDIVNYKEEVVDNIIGDFTQYEISKVGTTEINVQVGSNKSTLDIYISCNKVRLPDGEFNQAPKTLKLMAISGVQIPILEQYEQFSTSQFDGYETIQVSDTIPGYKETIQVIRTIQTDNTKYCTNECLSEGLGGQLIEDGPIVAAQELEFITSFDAGYNRSRITLLSDASMIQGRYLSDNNLIPENTYNFIRSLYPETEFEFENYGRQFVSHTKIVSPERGSATKYVKYLQDNESDNLKLNYLFGDYQNINIQNNLINMYESEYDPILINRPEVPWKDEIDGNKIEEIKNELISGFLNTQSSFGVTSKFSGIFDGNIYVDAGVGGGIPDLVKDKGYDYIDFDNAPSGYPGDLFGYSVAIRKNTILVGSLFSAFASGVITPYNYDSQFHLGYDGGAGSVYMFEKTGKGSGVSLQSVPWECTKKFRPDTLMGQLSGINIYSDQFGHSVAIDEDIIVIGAPNHDYGNDYNIINNSGAFVRKSFNESFFITNRKVLDLGSAANREIEYYCVNLVTTTKPPPDFTVVFSTWGNYE